MSNLKIGLAIAVEANSTPNRLKELNYALILEPVDDFNNHNVVFMIFEGAELIMKVAKPRGGGGGNQGHVLESRSRSQTQNSWSSEDQFSLGIKFCF